MCSLNRKARREREKSRSNNKKKHSHLNNNNNTDKKKASSTTATDASASSPSSSSSSSTSNWVPVLRPEDLPKGSRREVRVAGRPVLLFWYRNQIYAIEARSPAEGAYSEGFADAKLTQDYCIECPTTKTLFSLKTGEIVAWYPTNPVLRALTPRDTCRSLDIFPVKVTQDAISVDASASGGSGGSAVPSTRGGADSSIDRNNVYAISPKTYTSDDDFYAPAKATGASSSGTDISATAATITSAVAVAAAGAAGTAVAIYKDLGVPAIVAVWVAVGAATYAYSRSGKE